MHRTARAARLARGASAPRKQRRAYRQGEGCRQHPDRDARPPVASRSIPSPCAMLASGHDAGGSVARRPRSLDAHTARGSVEPAHIVARPAVDMLAGKTGEELVDNGWVLPHTR